MKYKIFIQRSAQKELADLQSEFYDKVKNAIWELADEPRPEGCRKLAGRDGWRIRVGNYRVIYEIYDTNRTIIVLHIGHRRDIYK